MSALVDLLMRQPMLTKQDLAVRYRVTVRTIEVWVRNRTLARPVRINGPRWRPADILAWEKAMENQR